MLPLFYVKILIEDHSLVQDTHKKEGDVIFVHSIVCIVYIHTVYEWKQQFNYHYSTCYLQYV